jgi:excisionase family DNA binding protein
MTDQVALTISVVEAGRRLGLGRDSAYAAAREGKIPVIKFGRLCRVPIRALERMLEQASAEQKPAA